MTVTEKQYALLKALRKGGKKACQLLNNKNTQLLLREIAVNTLAGNIPLSSKHKAQLKKRAADVRLLAKKKTSQKRRLKIEQTGGFLGMLLGPALSFLAKAIFH